MNVIDALRYYIDAYMPTMDGWCCRAKAEALTEVVLKTSPQLCVEIGVYGGRSLIALALAMQHSAICGDQKPGHIIGIDPWTPEASESGHAENDPNRKWWGALDHSLILQRCEQHIRNQGVVDLVTLVRLTSDAAFKIFGLAKEPCIDLLHIDGNHSEKHSYSDVNNYVPLVKPGGVVVFDDTNWNSTARAQELLGKLCKFDKFVEYTDSTGGTTQCGFYLKL